MKFLMNRVSFTDKSTIKSFPAIVDFLVHSFASPEDETKSKLYTAESLCKEEYDLVDKYLSGLTLSTFTLHEDDTVLDVINYMNLVTHMDNSPNLDDEKAVLESFIHDRPSVIAVYGVDKCDRVRTYIHEFIDPYMTNVGYGHVDLAGFCSNPVTLYINKLMWLNITKTCKTDRVKFDDYYSKGADESTITCELLLPSLIESYASTLCSDWDGFKFIFEYSARYTVEELEKMIEKFCIVVSKDAKISINGYANVTFTLRPR